MSANRHVLSGIRECSIMLDYVFCAPRRGFYHHPCSKWIRECSANFNWTIEHTLALCAEYTFRYDKQHANQNRIEEYADIGYPFDNHQDNITPFYQAVAPECKQEDAVAAYRAYYLSAKKHLLAYTRREVPDWIKEKGLGRRK